MNSFKWPEIPSEVQGISIKSDEPIPAPHRNKRTGVKAAMSALEVGQYLDYPNRNNVSRVIADLAPLKLFTSRKQPNGTYRIWRTK